MDNPIHNSSERSTALTPSPQSRYNGSVPALHLELAKCLQLVVPASMTADDRAAWIAAAVDALEDIRADEVAAISAELRRSVTRPNQIVPEIARLVADKRKRTFGASTAGPLPGAAERRIDEEARERWQKATCRADYVAVWTWERRERINAGLSVMPLASPLTEYELASLPEHIVALGLKTGLVERRGGRLVEVPG